MDLSLFTSYRDRVLSNVGKVIVGKDDAILRVLAAYLCSGNILLEDVPGTGKTMLLRAFSKSVGGDFRRIQFTPDLMPGDLTGVSFYNQKTNEFEFRKGPLFSQIVLADEINRATPRTQSALLEAMEERQITVDGETYPMASNFMVMATENPLESFGTFPLPEAQTDRFFMRIRLGYMQRDQEIGVISRPPSSELIAELEQVVTQEETTQLKSLWPQIEVIPDIAGYIMDIIEATRKGGFKCGASTRGAIALYNASQITAALSGRDYVIPEDVKAMAPNILAHRIVSGGGLDTDKYIIQLLSELPAPVEKL